MSPTFAVQLWGLFTAIAIIWELDAMSRYPDVLGRFWCCVGMQAGSFVLVYGSRLPTLLA